MDKEIGHFTVRKSKQTECKIDLNLLQELLENINNSKSQIFSSDYLDPEIISFLRNNGLIVEEIETGFVTIKKPIKIEGKPKNLKTK